MSESTDFLFFAAERAAHSSKVAGPLDINNPEGSFGGTKLRPFEKTDWYGWAGAEPFHQGPGGEPLIAEVKVSGWPEEGDEEWAQYDNTATLIVDKNGVSLNGANGAMQYNTDHDDAIKIANGLISNQPVDINSLAGSWESINMDEPSGEEPQVPIDDTTASMKGAMLQVAGKIAGKCSACGHVGEDMKNGYCSSCHQKREEQKGLGGFQTGDFSGKEADYAHSPQSGAGTFEDPFVERDPQLSQRMEEHKIVLTGETTEDIQWALANAEQEGWTPEYIEAMKEELARRGHNAAAKTAKLPSEWAAEGWFCFGGNIPKSGQDCDYYDRDGDKRYGRIDAVDTSGSMGSETNPWTITITDHETREKTVWKLRPDDRPSFFNRPGRTSSRKVSFVVHCPGHRNSKGELAEWCIRSHKTKKILESFGSEEAAKSGLKNMESHKGSDRNYELGGPMKSVRTDKDIADAQHSQQEKLRRDLKEVERHPGLVKGSIENAFGVGDHVMTDIGEPGTIKSIREDDRGQDIYTLDLDDPTATPDGWYVARDFELKPLDMAGAAQKFDQMNPAHMGAGKEPVQLTVKLHGRPITYTKAELQEMLDRPDDFEQADNLPVWVQRSLLGTESVPKVPRERGGQYSNKAFDRAYAMTLQKIKGWLDSPTPVKITISERYPVDEKKHPWQQYQPEDSWTRTLKEGAEEATCKDCGGKYDPSKGSCGCHDNNSQ